MGSDEKSVTLPSERAPAPASAEVSQSSVTSAIDVGNPCSVMVCVPPFPGSPVRGEADLEVGDEFVERRPGS